MLHFILCRLQFAGAQAGRSQGWVQQGGMLLRKKRYAERSSILSGCTVLCWSQVSLMIFICCFHKPVLPLSNSSLAVWTWKAEQAQMEASMPISGYCVYTTVSMLETTQDHIVLSYLIRRTCLRKQNPLISVQKFISMKIPLYHHWKSMKISQCIWCCLAMFGQSPPLSRSAKSRSLCWVPPASSKAIRLTSSESGRAMSTRRLVRLDGNWWELMGTVDHVYDGVLPFNFIVLVQLFEVFGGLK